MYDYGKYTKMITLPVGTKFWVRNGFWEGEIVEVDNVKCIHAIGVHIVPIKELGEDYELAIDILE
jgi:hypothetical protein